MNKVRGFLYKLAKLMGDANAIQKGKVGKRVKRIFYALVGIVFGGAILFLLDWQRKAVMDAYIILSALTLYEAIRRPCSYTWLNPKGKKILKDCWKNFRKFCKEEEEENHKENLKQ